jgi:hypothetical protein
MNTSRRGSWLDGLKAIFCRLCAKAGRPCPTEEDRPITTEEAVDLASEDSFPASDPPSYTGSIT